MGSTQKLLLLTLFGTALLGGCKSTPKTPFEERPSRVLENIYDNQPTAEAPERKVKPVTFHLEPQVSSPELKKIADKYRSISVSEFRLKGYKLHKFNFDNSVLFQYDKSDLSLVDSKEIKEFAKAYGNHGTGKHLYVVGHTDSRGSRAYNQSLSVRRAMVIASILERHGVPHSLIKLVPAGEVLPAQSNGTKAGRAANRRVEIFSADSKELVKAFLRQIDCSSVDAACTKAMLPIMDLERQGSGLHIRNVKADAVVTQAPELNQLRKLAKHLSGLGADFVDDRYATISEEERLTHFGGSSQRKALQIKIIKRDNLALTPDIRKPLVLPERYYFKL